MKLTTCNNNEMVIQARDEADYEAAYKVAKIICKNDDMNISAVDEDMFFICIGTEWSNFNAAQLKDEYQLAKKAL